MAVEGKVVEVKRGEPVPAHVAVGDVVVVQPDHGGPKFGMPHAEVTVSSLSSEWPFPMCYSCVLPDRCTLDQGLCCYACCCTVCAHAEVADQNGVHGLLRQKEWYKQCTVILCASILPYYLCACTLPFIWAPCIMLAYGTQVRDGVKRKWGLPDDECCGPTWTTYLPAYISLYYCPILFPNQATCAAYQMLYFMKKQGAPAPECPCYKHVCVHCSPPVDGAAADKYQREVLKIGSNLRNMDDHSMEHIADDLHGDAQKGDLLKNQNTKDGETVTTTQPT